MNGSFAVAICCALAGVPALSEPAFAQHKTAKQCNDEWTADKAAIQAGGKTRRVFVAECRGLPAPAGPNAVALGAGQFATETDAKASCPSDAVVWVNLRSKVAHAGGSRSYGRTKQGAYMCEKESVTAGFRAPARPKTANPAAT